MLTNTFTVKTSHYIIGAIGVVAAISWKDAVKDITTKYFPSQDNILATVINALIMTMFLIIMIYLLPDTKSELPPQTRERLTDLENKSRKEPNIIKMNNYY